MDQIRGKVGRDPIDPFRYTTERRAGYDWWSLQPLQNVDPPVVKDAKWAANPFDQFILQRLDRGGAFPVAAGIGGP